MSPDSTTTTDAVPRAVWHSTWLLMAGRLWTALAGFVCLAALTREDLPWAPLASAEFGQLTFYLALYVLLDCWADFGTSSATIQLGADDPQVLGGAIRAGRRIRAGAAGLAALAVSVGAWLAGEAQLGWIALASLAPLTRAAELSVAVYHSEIRWGVPVLVRSACAAARLLAFGLMANAGVDHFGPYLASFALLGGLANLALYLLARPRLGTSFQRIPWRALFIGALPLAALGIAQQAYFYADNLILRAMVSAEELGHYNAAVKIMGLMVMASVFATTSALPWLTRQSRVGRLGGATSQLAGRLFPLACALLGLLWPLSSWLLGALFGAAFEAAGPALQWLLLGAAAIYAGAPLLTALVASSRSGEVLRVVFIGLGFNLMANPPLISAMGIQGAALATLLTEALVGLAAYRALGRGAEEPLLGLRGLLLGPLFFGSAAWLSSSLLT